MSFKPKKQHWLPPNGIPVSMKHESKPLGSNLFEYLSRIYKSELNRIPVAKLYTHKYLLLGEHPRNCSRCV